MPEIYHKVISAFNKGNLKEANEFQVKAMRVIQKYALYNGVPAGKAIMKYLGINLGHPRKPFTSLTEIQTKDLLKTLNSNSI